MGNEASMVYKLVIDRPHRHPTSGSRSKSKSIEPIFVLKDLLNQGTRQAHPILLKTSCIFSFPFLTSVLAEDVLGAIL